jgi:hypothetical protein
MGATAHELREVEVTNVVHAGLCLEAVRSAPASAISQGQVQQHVCLDAACRAANKAGALPVLLCRAYVSGHAMTPAFRMRPWKPLGSALFSASAAARTELRSARSSATKWMSLAPSCLMQQR